MRPPRALAGLLLVGACHATPPATTSVVKEPLLPPAIRTTSWRIASGNLDAQIASTQRRLERDRTDAAVRRRLVALLKTRMTFGARLEDAAALEQLATMAAGSVESLLARAEARLAVHRLRDAEVDLAQARSLGAPAATVDPIRAALLDAAGRHRESARLRATLPVTFDRLVHDGVFARDEGRLSDAAAAFAEARALVRDVSPFPVAWLELEEAKLLRRRGDRDAARALLTRVRARVPKWPAAVLAEAELFEHPDAAIETLRTALLEIDHPELADRLAALLRLTARFEEAGLVRERAIERWRELVAVAPDAFSSHAAAALLDHRSLEAADLAKHDALRRDTRAAWLLASDAAWSAGLRTEACEAWAKAKALAADDALPKRPGRECVAVSMRR